MSIYKHIAQRASIEDYERHVQQGIAKIEDAYRLLEQAQEALGPIGCHVLPSHLTLQLPKIESVRREIWRKTWMHTFDATGLKQIMDAQACDEFDQTLERNPPEYTADNVKATFLEMASQADTLFQRGIVNVFRRLSRNYKSHTNQPFVVPPKIIMSYSCRPDYGGGTAWCHGQASDRINDIDRVIKTLDGQKHIPRSAESAMNAAWRDSDEFEDAYYKARCFRNQNVHLTFKRADLLEQANQLIADYYGNRALGDAA